MIGKFRGLGIAPFGQPYELIEYAKMAEEYKLDGFWLGEAYHGRSAISCLSAVATVTSKLTIGTSVISVFTRHPAVIAMEAATIDELSKGRFILGLGVNTTALVKHGSVSSPSAVLEAKPLAAMRDTINIVRKFLSNDRVIYQGRVFQIAPPGSRLDFEPIRRYIPIYVGSRSPKILQLCGEVADGLIISRSLSSSLNYVKYCIEQVSAGAHRAKRDLSRIDIAANLNLSVSKDSERAKRAVRRVVSLYVADPNLDATQLILKHTNIDEEELKAFKAKVLTKGFEEASESLPDVFIEELAIAGSPDECIEKLEKIVRIGVNTLIAFDVLGPDRKEAIRLLAEEIKPQLEAQYGGCVSR